MAENNNNTDTKITVAGKVKFSEKLNGFIQRNRKALAICLCLVIIGVAGFIVASVVNDSLTEKAWSRVEEFSSRYDNLKKDFNLRDLDELQNEISEFAASNKGFPAARAYSLVAFISEDKENWAEAETAWVNAANAAGESYFAPVSFFHAALTAEEYGNLSSAIEYYEKAAQMEDVFPAAPRAMFSAGRLKETQGNKAAALETYRALADRRPADEFWGSLAQSRILFLEGK